MNPTIQSPTLPSIRRVIRILAAVLVLGFGFSASAQAQMPSRCDRWLDKVAQSPSRGQSLSPEEYRFSISSIDAWPSDPWGVASFSEADKMEAIECLLTAENDMRPAAFSGVVRLEISQTFAQAHVNIAALYAISYIYTGRFDHAGAVALRGEGASYTDHNGNYVTRVSAIHRAYKAYRRWFQQVRQHGLGTAHASADLPLDGSGLRWYSRRCRAADPVFSGRFARRSAPSVSA